MGTRELLSLTSILYILLWIFCLRLPQGRNVRIRIVPQNKEIGVRGLSLG